MKSKKFDQNFYGRGKLLLSGEYFILDGAKGLALPVKLGQRMDVRYEASFNPKLHWCALDERGKSWLSNQFELWHFEADNNSSDPKISFLSKLMRGVRKHNSHFLREGESVYVTTKLEFPRDWGLGSSSSLIHNVAQWGMVDPFELLPLVQGGSGYDIACAGSTAPLLFQRQDDMPTWEKVTFSPPFKNNLYFLYLGKKQDTAAGIEYFRSNRPESNAMINDISQITDEMISSKHLATFEELMAQHEAVVAYCLRLTRVKEERFSDYWGEIKSLGAWGGDFALVSSQRSYQETAEYFYARGLDVLLPYVDLAVE